MELTNDQKLELLTSQIDSLRQRVSDWEHHTFQNLKKSCVMKYAIRKYCYKDAVFGLWYFGTYGFCYSREEAKLFSYFRAVRIAFEERADVVEIEEILI